MRNKIEKSNVQDILELNAVQKGMLFHYLKDDTANLYNVQLSLMLHGDLDISLLQQAVKTVQKNNEVLRSVFSWERISTPVQIICKECPVDVAFQDISGNTEDYIAEFVNDYQQSEQKKRFDLTGLPIRFGVIKTSPRSFIFSITHHHILYDGWSTGILLKELFQAYDQLNSGQAPGLAAKTTYKQVQQARERRTGLAKNEHYWEGYLKGYEYKPFFTGGHVFAGNADQTEKLQFSLASMEMLEAFSVQYKVTKAAIIYAAYGLVLQKAGSVSDVVFGTVISGRNVSITGVEDVMGSFINTVPFRIGNTEGKLLWQVVADVHKNGINRQDFDDTSYFEIKQKLKIKPTETLFDSSVAIENYPLDDNSLKNNRHFGIKLKSVYENTDMPLMVTVFFRDTLEIELAYKSNTISTFFAQSLGEYLIKIIRQIVFHPNESTEATFLLQDESDQALLQQLKFTGVGFPANKTIVDLFIEQVARTPDNIALTYGHISMTYSELDTRTSQLALLLREKGVKADHIVGLLTQRSIETVIGMLAILKAGGAYLPIDVDYPAERIEYLIKDSGTNIILTTRDVKHDIGLNVSVLFIEDTENLPAASVAGWKADCKPSNLCYIIYTSGTTGNPKGVMVEHRNVVRLLFNDNFQFDFTERDVWTMFHSPCFDFSVWEMYGALLFGGKLIIIPRMVAMDTAAYLKILKTEKVTVLNQTPSAFYNLMGEELATADRLLQLRYIIFGGEALSPDKLKAFKERYPEIKLINMFGITETTVHVTYKEIGLHEITHNISNIGKPIPTLSTYIFDKYQRVALKGAIGELYVGGAGVTRGYLGKEKLTSEKFITNPYDAGERLYRTGDLARILSTGDIEYLGRIDNQVQLRGFRIELGEIESQLRKHEEINETVVVAKERNGNSYLVAYYIAAHEISANVLRRFLLEKLPDYMAPSYYVRMEDLPLTANGKLNTKMLPEPEMRSIAEPALPKNEIQKGLVRIWAELLEIEEDKIGVHTNFFDIGGNSLMLVKMASKISKVFNVDITVAKLFAYPVIAYLADFLDKKEEADATARTTSDDNDLKQINATISVLNQMQN